MWPNCRFDIRNMVFLLVVEYSQMTVDVAICDPPLRCSFRREAQHDMISKLVQIVDVEVVHDFVDNCSSNGVFICVLDGVGNAHCVDAIIDLRMASRFFEDHLIVGACCVLCLEVDSVVAGAENFIGELQLI